MKEKINKYIESIRNSKYYLRLKNWALSTSLPGFEGVPLYNVFKFLYNQSLKENLSTKANSIAFSLIIALFPFLIFLFTLTAYLPIPDFNEVILTYLNSILPEEASLLITGLIDDILTEPRGALLSFGFILTVYFSSNALMEISHSFSKSYNENFEKRGGLKERLLAIRMTIIMGVLFIITAILSILGRTIVKIILNYINSDSVSFLSLSLLRYLILFTLLYSIIAILYRYLPATTYKFKLFTPGALVTTILVIIASELFSFYVDNFANYNKFYGSLGTIIILMLWAQFNSFILLAGYELNTSIKLNKDGLYNTKME